MNIQLPITSVLGVGMISFGSLVILVNQDVEERRYSVLAYILHYIGAVLLLVRIFSPQILFILFITGFAGGLILGTEHVNWQAPIRMPDITPGLLFRAVFSLVLWVMILSIEPRIAVWIPIPDSILFSSLWMIVMGIAIIGLNDDHFMMFLGLLLVFFGFELVYILLEDSSLVFGFLTAINLLIALSGAYVLIRPEKDIDASQDSDMERFE